MNEFLHDPVNAWLAAGALIIAFEAFTAPGLGLFLGGLGALCTACLLKAGLIDVASTGAQFACCFGATVLWALALWKPLRRFREKRRSRYGEVPSNNLIGETATVARSGLKAGETGQVLWSGTLMNAELAPSLAGALPEGAKVVILSVSGNTLRVTPK